VIDASTDADLRRLLDKDAIADVLARYCRGVDRCDADLITSAFHADAVDDHSYIRLTGSEVGAYLVERMLSMFKASLHTLLQSLIEVDGDNAHGETYYVAWLIREEAGKEVVDQASGRYVDRFERRGGEWRIAYRIVLPEVAIRLQGGSTDLLKFVADRPQRHRNDVSYRRPLQPRPL
jgi:ketosteroid isomerase-like protein